MLTRFWKWLWESDGSCDNCRVLRDLLEYERYDKQKLINALIEVNKPVIQTVEKVKEVDPVALNMPLPWRVRQQMLEAEDRQAAALIRKNEAEKAQSVEELEKELGVENAG